MTLGKTGKNQGRPAPPLTCGYREAREDREDGRRTLHSASGAAAPVFPSSLGLMGEDGKTETPARTHALYRFYDGDGDLLYVGITADLGSRWKQHSKDKPWWAEVRSCTVEPYPDRDTVLLAERLAIRAEDPRHNVPHVRRNHTAPQPRPVDRPLNEANRTPGPNWLGTVGTFGMTDGTCPVGIVVNHDRTGLTLGLYSWLTGYFGAGTRRIAIGDLRTFCIAFEMSDRDIVECGIYPDGDVVWDMDPVGEFQTAWRKQP